LQLVLESKLLEAFRSEVEVFQAPPDLLAGQRLFAELLLRCADRFDAEHGVDEAADLEDLAGLVPFWVRKRVFKSATRTSQNLLWPNVPLTDQYVVPVGLRSQRSGASRSSSPAMPTSVNRA
jgi:hypothetical protein